MLMQKREKRENKFGKKVLFSAVEKKWSKMEL